MRTNPLGQYIIHQDGVITRAREKKDTKGGYCTSRFGGSKIKCDQKTSCPGRDSEGYLYEMEFIKDCQGQLIINAPQKAWSEWQKIPQAMVHVVSKMRAPRIEWAPDYEEGEQIWKTIISHKTTRGLVDTSRFAQPKLNKGNTIKKWIAKKEFVDTSRFSQPKN